MGVSAGADCPADGFVPHDWSLLNQPYCTSTLVNPACCSVCCACWQLMFDVSGIGLDGGPLDTVTLTVVCPGCTSAWAPGDCARIVPAGALLSCWVTWRLMLCWPAQLWMVWMFCPTRLGSPRPATWST